MTTSPKRIPPRPIFDTLDRLSSEKGKATLGSIETDVPLSSVESDYQSIKRFLLSYDGSTATFNAYRRDLERLCHWSWLIKKAAIASLNRDQIEQFIRFTQRPPKAWIGLKNVARFISRDGERLPNAEWRPFVSTVSKKDFAAGAIPDLAQYAPSHAVTKAMFTSLSSFYDYLVTETLITTNPVKTIRQKSKFIRKEQHAAVVRRLSNLQWDYLIETAEEMAVNEPEEHERTLFVISALFAMYLRISELVTDERSAPIMGDFRKDLDGHWWFHVTGKGNKDRTITVSEEMMKALRRYRIYRGLTALPDSGEMAPLVPKHKGSGPITSTRHIRLIVQQCFNAALDRMHSDGMLVDAAELKIATVHWLRHTGISEDVKARPREHVRDDAGHASMATTDRYIDSDRRERHQTGSKKRIRDL